MSGSVTQVRVTPSPEELARIELERRRRAAVRDAASRATSLQVVSSPVPQRASADTGRTTHDGAGFRRAADPRRAGAESAGRSARTRRRHLDQAEPVSAASRPQAGDRSLVGRAVLLADEARSHGYDELAEDMLMASNMATLNALEQELDDELDAAAFLRVVEERLDRAVRTVVGTDWVEQSETALRSPAGDRLTFEVTETDDPPSDQPAVVEIRVSLDARSDQINGRPTGSCDGENRAVREILTAAVSTPAVRPLSEPKIVGSGGAAARIRPGDDEDEDEGIAQSAR
jgi:hypothetical protein